MKNNPDPKIDQYELFPIGKIKSEGMHTYVYILQEYKAALKYLGLFSHAMIFFKSSVEYENSNPCVKAEEDIDLAGTRGFSNNCVIDFITVKTLHVDEKTGIIEIDYSDIPDDTLIFDIKPYFPCEDRVKVAVTPDSIGSWPEWRNDKLNTGASTADIVHGLWNMEQKGHYPVCQIGSIRKAEGDYYLKLNNTETDLINNLAGFSHIKILWWFDKFDKSQYRKTTEANPPYENAPRTGIFATRSPVRPNPIAITTARILDVDLNNRHIKVSNLDSFDKTPIINIVPYIPALDRVRECRVPDWLKHWPEWIDDRETDSAYGEIEIVESDVERINELIPLKGNDTRDYNNLFEEKTQGVNNHSDDIIVKGARQNNLKNINCTIPRNKMTVITGVSGSGKSSLAFDTIYSESQRRFIECMSNSGGALALQIDKPDFDQMTGLPPAVAIEQKTAGRNPRSTVGTMTDIYDYLRLLFAKIGTRHCPECGRAIVPLKTDEIVDILTRLPVSTLLGIQAFNNKEILGEFIIPDKAECISDFIKQLKECVKKALLVGNGAIAVNVDNTEEFLFQTKEMCYHCNRIFFELTTSTFSFNNPESMCPVCKGLGVKLDVDVDLIIANPDLSILDGASEWWGNLRKHRQKPNANWMKGEILALAEELGVDLELPWWKLPESFRKQALYGSSGRRVRFLYENTNGRKGEIVRPVEGAFNSITRLFRENTGDTANRIASAFMREKDCHGCRGERLNPEGRLVSIGKTRFPETVVMTIEELKNWINNLPQKLSEEKLNISIQILRELNKRLENLIDVGVPYLTLDRPVPALSGGEAQRLRLATQLGSGITNILYVLDEPSIGLHPKDHNKLIQIMHRIRDEGNTIIVVEHDADTMLVADKIIDIGPGAGVHGGSIIGEGTPEEIMQNSNSETGKYLAGIRNVDDMGNRNRKKPYNWIRVSGARHNNLKGIDVEIPLGVFTCVTGVSGSGKSSLVLKTLYPALAKYLNKSDDVPGNYDRIEGHEGLDKIISISQHPIGRTPRSNPATYIGVFDEIRNLYASLEEARKKGYKNSKFSFNSKDGQCEACGGEGRKCVEMHFMSDIWVECSVCHGKRFNTEALEIKYKGKSISDVLDMNVEEALELFADSRRIKDILQTLKDVGMGYIKLGQSALTLSGGEAQRVKLAKELSKTDTGKTIFLLDEPTTGLHFSDVRNLLGILHRITQTGSTVLVIEHNLAVIRNADWIIDLGPEGGNAGGYVVAQGTPEEVAKAEGSYTGALLRASGVH